MKYPYTPLRSPVYTMLLALFIGFTSCVQEDKSAESQSPVATAIPVASENKDSTIPEPDSLNSPAAIPAESVRPAAVIASSTADAETIITRQQVPILCYHQVRDWREKDSKAAKDYIIPEERFREHIKMLADSGYQTVLPDQLMAYLTTGATLPAKPVMLTFDDTNLDQYTVAAPELEKYGFKGVFFIMTVSLGRPNYMSKAQVKDLADRGHIIGSHTWDHHNVKKYEGKDWITQIEKPSRQLAEITGKPTEYFAYPFGLWNPEAIPELKQRGIKGAFQLAGKRDPQDPLHSIRRIIASGYWSSTSLNKAMKNSF
ncbi:polysaccharide deacetylase family protein [Pontibacter sp. JH31]|uniref:Polysaccharide deacetylase family protein n=1 Tax=Pontibacter aquaedesilientis TaxID=2766980 RepID=A0ABR7XEF8_9BACT|nr:polysaccharide deacetylase family protein [Pontibacter aquaedesilientis]MBD1396681.1 polysaccharide deacetylase family protein [Pontibacter aquaedesilientis]